MATTAEQIDLWRLSPREHQRLEFKEAKTQSRGFARHVPFWA